MSLLLVQDYSSEEEVEEETLPSDNDDFGSEDEKEQQTPPSDDAHNIKSRGNYSSQVSNGASPLAASSLLPSPEDLFSEVTGPPEFLKSSATEPLFTRAKDIWQPSSGAPLTPIYRSDPATDSGPGVVLEIKAKSSGSHKQGQADSQDGTDDGREGVRSVKGVVFENSTAAPRIYIAAEMKNPTSEAEKRNRSKIKDKEKNKRMKGQSSHATWKSETEMQLRQQFD